MALQLLGKDFFMNFVDKHQPEGFLMHTHSVYI